MDPALMIPIAVAAAVAAGIWALMTAFDSKEDRVAERLQELKDPRKRGQANEASGKEAGVSQMFKKAAPTLSKAFQPKTDLEQDKLQVKLANAGFNSPNSSVFYLATKMACMAVGLVVGGGVGLVVQGFKMETLISVILGAGLGMYLPDIALLLMVRGRQEKIFLSLPDALDLMVVCVESGLGLDAAMRRVAIELDESAPEICSELNHSNLQLQMGRNRREVLHDLGIRTGVDDVKALVAILIQADKFGSSIAKALRVQSDSMRVKRSQLAEERAAGTAVKMIFPLVLFIFPGIFVVLVGPAAIMMIRQLLTH